MTGRRYSVLLLHQPESVGVENFADLVAGVNGPGSGVVEANISAPMRESAAGLADFFVGEREVVMSVGVGGSEQQGGFVRADRIRHAAGFIEHVAQIEIGQGVSRINVNGATIVLLRARVFLTVVIKRAQVD